MSSNSEFSFIGDGKYPWLDVCLPFSLDFDSSSFPLVHRDDNTLDRWCQALKLEKLERIFCLVYTNSDFGVRAFGVLAKIYRL